MCTRISRLKGRLTEVCGRAIRNIGLRRVSAMVTGFKCRLPATDRSALAMRADSRLRALHDTILAMRIEQARSSEDQSYARIGPMSIHTSSFMTVKDTPEM